MNKKKILLFGVAFAISLLAGSFVARVTHFRSEAKKAEFIPYTIVWQVIDEDKSGKRNIICTETRFKFSDGRWRDVKRYPDGTVEEMISEPGRGVFNVGRDRLHFLSQAQEAPANVKIEDYATSPQYDRYETVQGLMAAVLRSEIGEIYVVADLGGDWIKTVFHSGDGKRICEPVALILGQPDAANFEYKDMAVSTEAFKRIHNEDKMSGSVDR